MTDKGSQFYANEQAKDQNVENGFEIFLRENVTSHILSRIKLYRKMGK